MDQRAISGDRLFSSAFMISVILHGVMLFVLPGLRLLDTFESNEWLEVDIIIRPEIDAVLPESLPGTGAGSGGDPETVRIGESPMFPNPPVWLPDRIQPIQAEPAPLRLRIPTDQTPDIAGPGVSIPGFLSGLDMSESSTETFEPVGIKPPGMPWKPSQQPLARTETSDDHDLQITGEVAHRTVIFRPPPPRAVTAASGMVILTFTVEPDGTIGRIVPVIRTNPGLEQIAISYLERWRFESVSDSTGSQTGTITIRFRFQQ